MVMDLVRLGVAVTGTALVAVGVDMIHRPSAFIAVGAMLIAAAVVGTLRSRA